MSADKLRRLQTERVLQAVRELLEHVEDNGAGHEHVAQVLERFELSHEHVMGAGVARRQRRADSTVARAAVVYAAAAAGERRRAVADALGYSLSNADKVIRDARNRGYLDGDEATDRAREVSESSDSR